MTNNEPATSKATVFSVSDQISSKNIEARNGFIESVPVIHCCADQEIVNFYSVHLLSVNLQYFMTYISFGLWCTGL
ncbi:hypothetical protein P3L10_020454 [Capsicum annuum]